MSEPVRLVDPQASAQSDGVAVFNDCYAANYRSIRRFVTRLINDSGQAEEVTQDTFVRLWQAIQDGVEISEPRAWLYRVAANMATSLVRRSLVASHHEPRIKDSVRTWHPLVVDAERAALYRELVPMVLRRLPEPMRLSLLLYHEGLTGAEMARVIGVKPSYMGTLVLRAQERFRREYERLENGDGLPR